MLMLNDFICSCWLMRQFDLLSSYHRVIRNCNAIDCRPMQFRMVGRSYFNFGKNSAAVLQVAALNSSSEQPFTWATVSEISFT